MSNSSDEIPEAELKLIQQLIKDPQGRELVARVLSGEKFRTNKPYYNRENAMLVKPIVDEMVATREDREFRFDDYAHWSKSTLRSKVHQAIQYLVDHLDDDNQTYRKWRDTVIIAMQHTGIVVNHVEHSPHLTKGFVAHKLGSGKDRYEWKKELLEFIETSERGTMKIIKDISLTTEEILEAKTILSGVSSEFTGRIQPTEIRIIHENAGDEVE